MSDERKYCMCCGEDVPVTSVHRDGRVELNCVLCGFTLDIAAPEPETRHTVPCIIAVDAADASRTTVHSLLEHRSLADEIVALHSSADFVSTIARRFAENLPVNLVILDVELPSMDGFTAAGFLRSLETKLHRQPCPLIFFTARKANDTLRRQMSRFHPAWYCAKGEDADLAVFERRATSLINHITDILSRPPAET